MPNAAVRQRWTYVLDDDSRILIADDDPILAEFAKVHLSTPTSTVDSCPDGLTAWQRLQADEFDLALIDIEMPGLDGFALTERIRSDPRLRHLPVVMLTGREDIVSIDRAFEVGATSFVTKPVNWRQLSHQLRYVLRTSRLEADGRKARDRAEAAAAMKDNMLALLQHEFRTPLHTIIGFAGLLQDATTENAVAGQLREYANHVASAARDLHATFSHVLQYAEITSGQYDLREDEYKLAGILKAAVDTVAEKHGIDRRRIDLPAPVEELRLRCDRDLTIGMLAQLVDNAVVHGGDGRIAIAVACDPGHGPTIAIEDQGPGLTPEQVQMVTAPFAQGSTPYVRKAGGLGLGLSIAREIVLLHGGSLTIARGAGGGARIEITLPPERAVRPDRADERQPDQDDERRTGPPEGEATETIAATPCRPD